MIYQVIFIINFIEDDENLIIGYRNKDFYGLVSKKQYYSYLEKFSYECFFEEKEQNCKLDIEKKEFIYDSKEYFLGLCEPLYPSLTKEFPNFPGYSKTSKLVIIGMPLIIINSIIAAILM